MGLYRVIRRRLLLALLIAMFTAMNMVRARDQVFHQLYRTKAAMTDGSMAPRQQSITRQHRFSLIPKPSTEEQQQQLQYQPTGSVIPTKNPRPVRLGCILFKCADNLLRCFLDKPCNQMLQCLSQCNMPGLRLPGWPPYSSIHDNEHSDRCSIRCVLRPLHTPAISAFLGCLTSKQCLTQQSAPGGRRPTPSPPSRPDNCPLPSRRLMTFRYPEDLLGKWWVARGLSAVYDCWPCQSMDFSLDTTNDPGLNQGSSNRLRYNYAMHIDNDLPRSIPCIVQPFNASLLSASAAISPIVSLGRQRQEEIGHLTTHYTVAELFSGTDDWHVLDRTEDNRFMLIYYCGQGELSPNRYQGAVVMIRDGWSEREAASSASSGATATPTVPNTVLDRFTDALYKAGLQELDTRRFCVNRLERCE